MSTTEGINDTESENVSIEYGDQFRHIITGDVKTVHDARPDEDRVVWSSGGWDPREEIVRAITGGPSMYEVEARDRDRYEQTPY